MKPDDLNPVPMILLGAGASVEAGLPTSLELVKQVRILLLQSHSELIPAFDYFHERLSRVNEQLDIETVYSAVLQVQDAADKELSLFVERWQPQIKEWTVKTQGSYWNDTLLNRLAVAIKELVCRVLWLDLEDSLSKHRVDYLTPLIDWIKSIEAPVCISTLNFDNVIELGARIANLPIRNTVFELYDTQESNFLFPRPSTLDCPTQTEINHIHGYVECSLGHSDTSDGKPSAGGWPELVYSRPDNPYGSNPALAFGTQKLERMIPIVDLLNVFRHRLVQHNVLFVVGYSYRDTHINQCIFEWQNSSMDFRRIYTISPTADSLSVSMKSGGFPIRSKLLCMTAGEFYREIPKLSCEAFHY